MKLLASVRKLLSDRNRPEPPIALTDRGFSSQGSEVAWSDIIRVRAFKLDLLTWDEVRFIFDLSSGDSFEISEEQPGFEALVSAATTHFPTIAGWQEKIIKPAFNRNETIVYAK